LSRQQIWRQTLNLSARIQLKLYKQFVNQNLQPLQKFRHLKLGPKQQRSEKYKLARTSVIHDSFVFHFSQSFSLIKM